MKKLIKDKSLRVKLHFAETAMQMIIKDGVQSVSVRNVAKEAGYAYATIYNHFKNLDELLWLTRNLFVQDISEYMQSIDEPDSFISIFKQYANYYLEKQNVFEFMYFHKLNPLDKKEHSLVEEPDYEQSMIEQMLPLAEKSGITAERIQGIISTLIYAVHGLLTLSFAGNDELKPEDVPAKIDEVGGLLF